MGAGKTAMLNALVRAMPPAHRVLGCEVTRELSAPLFHGDYYQTRQVGVGSKGETEISLRDLVYQCLGMRADTLVVGEVRGPEAYELTRAGNAGCSLLCTIHANGTREAMNALVNTALLAGENVPAGQITAVFADIIDLVVHLDREDLAFRDGAEGGRIRRQVMEISRGAAAAGLRAELHHGAAVHPRPHRRPAALDRRLPLGEPAGPPGAGAEGQGHVAGEGLRGPAAEGPVRRAR